MQILVPLAMTFGLFGGESMELVNTSGTLIGKIPAASEAWNHNAGSIWLVFLVPLAVVGWWSVNNIKASHVTPELPSPIASFSLISGMLITWFYYFALRFVVMLPEKVGGSGFAAIY